MILTRCFLEYVREFRYKNIVAIRVNSLACFCFWMLQQRFDAGVVLMLKSPSCFLVVGIEELGPSSMIESVFIDSFYIKPPLTLAVSLIVLQEFTFFFGMIAELVQELTE